MTVSRMVAIGIVVVFDSCSAPAELHAENKSI